MVMCYRLRSIVLHLVVQVNWVLFFCICAVNGWMEEKKHVFHARQLQNNNSFGSYGIWYMWPCLYKKTVITRNTFIQWHPCLNTKEIYTHRDTAYKIKKKNKKTFCCQVEIITKYIFLLLNMLFSKQTCCVQFLTANPCIKKHTKSFCFFFWTR